MGLSGFLGKSCRSNELHHEVLADALKGTQALFSQTPTPVISNAVLGGLLR